MYAVTRTCVGAGGRAGLRIRAIYARAADSTARMRAMASPAAPWW